MFSSAGTSCTDAEEDAEDVENDVAGSAQSSNYLPSGIRDSARDRSPGRTAVRWAIDRASASRGHFREPIDVVAGASINPNRRPPSPRARLGIVRRPLACPVADQSRRPGCPPATRRRTGRPSTPGPTREPPADRGDATRRPSSRIETSPNPRSWVPRPRSTKVAQVSRRCCFRQSALDLVASFRTPRRHRNASVSSPYRFRIVSVPSPHRLRTVSVPSTRGRTVSSGARVCEEQSADR